MPPIAFYEASISLTPKPSQKTLLKKEKPTDKIYMTKHRYKNPHQDISKLNPTIYKRFHSTTK